jgi:hypothetical protein
VKRWYTFNYHNGHKVTRHNVTPEFVERVKTYVAKHKLDLIITEY